MAGLGVHFKFKEKMDTLKNIITDKTIIVGGGSIGMSFVEAIPEIIRVMTLLVYFFYVCVILFKEWKK